MTTPNTAPHPRFVLGPDPGIELLVDRARDGTPDAVEQLVAEAETAHAGWRLALDQARAADEEAKQAAAIDAAADRAAIAAGRELPTDRAVPAARTAATLARRRANAAGEHWRATLIEYCRSVEQNHTVWTAELRGVIEAQRAEASELLAALARILDAQAGARQILDGLGRWPHGGSLVGISFRDSHRNPDAVRQHRRDRAAQHIADLDHIGGPSAMQVERDPDSLIAALRALIDGPAPRDEVTIDARGLK